MMSRPLLLLLVVLGASACSLFGLGGSGDGPDGKSTGRDAGVVADPELAQVADECEDPYSDDVTSEALLAAQTAYAAGEASIALSPGGCVRLFVHRQDGQVTDERLLRPPYDKAYDTATLQFVYRAASDTRFRYRADGQTVESDQDGDGYFEYHQEVTYGQIAVREVRAAGDDHVVARTTATVVPPGYLVRVVEEALGDAGLYVVRDLTVSQVQKSCNPPADKPPPRDPNAAPTEYTDGVRDCSAAETATVTSSISTALQRGTGCLHAAGLGAESDKALRTVTRSELSVGCVDDSSADFIAAYDSGYMDLNPGKSRILVNFTNNAFGNGSQAARDGTIAHELFHSFDVHDPDLEASATGAQLAKTDRVYACEYLCFGPAPDACHLAACQGKTLPTQWMGKMCEGTLDESDLSKIEKARGDGVTIGGCEQGQNIGAVCHKANFGTQVMFCTTAMECNEMCQEECESKSLSCLPECR